MPRLFLLCEYATLNGGERSMLSTLETVRAAGWQPVVAAPPHGPLADALAARGIEFVRFETRGQHGQRLPSAELREELARVLGHARPRLLHANSLAMGRLSGPVAADSRIPSVAHLRDILRLGPQAVADLNCHNRLLAVSRATRDAHVAQGLEAARIHVLYNGVDLEQFRPRPPTGFLHRELTLPPGTPLIATIGQISLRKGQDVLAHAATTIADRTSAHWLILGERFSEKEESRRFEADLHRAAAGPLAGRLHVLGNREDVSVILNELTLLVHPARQEPLGRVLLEAAASGTAIIATDVGGTPEIFPADSDSTCLVPADDDDALAAAMLDLLDDAARRRNLALAARRRAEEAFDIHARAAELLTHYDLLGVGEQSPTFSRGS
jgi:glycosyltransferase involved in cell wall biosynthesis